MVTGDDTVTFLCRVVSQLDNTNQPKAPADNVALNTDIFMKEKAKRL